MDYTQAVISDDKIKMSIKEQRQPSGYIYSIPEWEGVLDLVMYLRRGDA